VTEHQGERAEERIRASFAKQGLMSTLGATLVPVASRSRSDLLRRSRSSMGLSTPGR
jgi:hypothetical protein